MDKSLLARRTAYDLRVYQSQASGSWDFYHFGNEMESFGYMGGTFSL